MKNKKVFCEICRDDVGYKIIDKKMQGKPKDKVYNYNGKIAYCDNCGAEIYVGEVRDYNLKALYDEYRKDNDIISLEAILEICPKYDIGKRPLSLLLGWGEQTFSRYCDGDVPSKQYSDILKRIYNEPEFYNKILEENKNNLSSEVAYSKSKKAVEKLLNKDLNENSKIETLIGYLLKECEDITHLSLQKSLYYVQGFFYAFFDEFLFEEDCQAWVHGPVYPQIYSKYKEYRFEPINCDAKIDNIVLSSSERAILESVVKNICCYSGKVLEKFTHSETPWIKARGNLKETEPSNQIIEKKEIGEYFKQIKEKYNMINPNDIETYTKKMFDQIQ